MGLGTTQFADPGLPRFSSRIKNSPSLQGRKELSSSPPRHGHSLHKPSSSIHISAVNNMIFPHMRSRQASNTERRLPRYLGNLGPIF
jgi:hypothetical protein